MADILAKLRDPRFDGCLNSAAAAEIERLRNAVTDVTNEMTSVDNLTGLGMRENFWKVKLLEATKMAGGK